MFYQGIEIDILDDTVIDELIAFFGESSGLPYMDPISGPIEGALEATLLYEGFKKG